MEAEAASFRTWMDSMSEALMSLMPIVVGMPSTMYSGSVLFSVPIPRMRMLACEVGSPVVLTFMPGTRPWRAVITSRAGLFLISSTETTVMEPVRSLLRWVV